MPRKIIQINSCVDDVLLYITALCNDGTVWLKFNDDVWSKIKDIPQDGYVEDDHERFMLRMPASNKKEEK